MAGRRSFLFTHWEGGGNTPPMLAVVRRLVARGHAVRVLSDPCNRAEVQAVGAAFTSWTKAPHRADKGPETDPIRDWEFASPIAVMGRLRDHLFFGPSLQYAQDVIDTLERTPADVVVTSEMLFGAMAAAEAAGVPCVAMMANVYLFPQTGVPPFGPGLMPSTSVVGRARDWFIRTMALREFGKGTAAYNETRRALGLDPLSHPFDQLERLAAQILLTSAAFDFLSPDPPKGLVYAGAELDDPAWSAPWQSPWPATDRRPLILVGFSSTFQNQADALRRVVHALAGMEVRAVVTTGPAIAAASLPAAPNVHVCPSAPHSQILKDAAAVITHCGHGTVIRTLAAGVPIVCMPMGRDQNENAARVVYRGAGVRIKPTASSAAIATAVRTVLHEPRYRERARAVGALIVRDARDSKAVPVLESIAASRGAASPPARAVNG